MVLGVEEMGFLGKVSDFFGFGKQDVNYPYLIEIRPMLEKYALKKRIKEIRERYRIRRTHRVPHITLVYNFRPKSGIKNWDLAEIIQKVFSDYDFRNLKFHYDGFELIKGKTGYVLAFKIRPSNDLRKFRMELYESLLPYIEQNPEIVEFNNVGKDEFWFHATVGFQMSETEYSRIKNDIHSLDEYMPAHPLRINVLKKSRIAYEFDTPTGTILGRRKALSREYYSQMLRGYRRIFDIESPNPPTDRAIWLISDTHFDHKNIIKYCGRPFSDLREMNGVLLNNWNKTLGSKNTIYFLGDASFGKKSRKPSYWLRKLNGNIRYIRGNHENEPLGKKYEVLDYRGYRFLLIHDPNKAKNFNGWVIHGHVHNNDLRKYPFINGANKTINVSVETINYKPVSLDWIISLGLKNVRRMETVSDTPKRI